MKLRSLALALAVLAGLAQPPAASAAPLQKAVLAGGCFWGMEWVFEQLRGVDHVVAGFSGGSASTADYEVVSMGNTGHAESVEITYDPARISYGTLLEVFFTVAHDPTTRDRQGPDEGTQYRSAVFYANAAQKSAALKEIAVLTASKTFGAPIVTQVVPLHGFYPAEAYHQHFAERNPDYPYIVVNDRPKIEALRQKYPRLLKANAVT